MSHPQIVDGDAVESREKAPEGGGFGHKRLSAAAGGDKLGCSLYILAPGRKSWPYHYHTANEEAIFVLQGRGTLRLAGEETDINEGDYVALPVGEAGAHRICNSSDDELRYLCFSTMIEPEIAVYPDSNMVGLFAGAPPGGNEEDATLKKYLQADAEVDYWEKEA